MKGRENIMGNRRTLGERMSSEDIEITRQTVKWIPPGEAVDMMVPGPVGGGQRVIEGNTAAGIET